MGPVPAVADIRVAVRHTLGDHERGDLVLVACSGGADSLALACAAAFVAPRLGLRCGAITVDHGLQEGSADRADAVVTLLRQRGLDPVESVAVVVGRQGGPEAAARDARYSALDHAAERLGARSVLLGHTRDDQAETVLLGLARGSGARSLAGMPSRFGPGERYRRPLLDIPRSRTREACEAEGVAPWHDPHNSDPAYTRSRVRHQLLPALRETLGPGMPEALARTARMLREDTEALDLWAADAFEECLQPWPQEPQPEVPAARPPSAAGAHGPARRDSARHEAAHPEALRTEPARTETVRIETVRTETVRLDIARLAKLPSAVRRRVIRLALFAAGAPAGTLAAVHIEAVDALVTDWRGQGPLDLPGPIMARRADGRLSFGRQPPGAAGAAGRRDGRRRAVAAV